MFKWFYNGIQIKSTEKVQVLNQRNVSTLVINKTQEDDSGLYDCTVETVKGKQLMKSSCIINIGSNNRNKNFYFIANLILNFFLSTCC